MAQLPEYKDLNEKSEFFQSEDHYQIDSRSQLDDWYSFYTAEIKKEYPTDFIYRGSNEAKYKMYTSAQRLWIQENLDQWRDNFSFEDFIIEIVNKAKTTSLIKEIFDLHGYSESERDFPIISLLQHYGAPSPVIDWTYDINRSIFFAVNGVRKSQSRDKKNINHYISIYLIDKREIDRRELLSLLDITQGDVYPSIDSLRGFGNEDSPNANALFMLTDFETTIDERYNGPLRIRTTKPLTSVFNQNIIAQQGLLMYNPFQNRPVEQLFNVDPIAEGSSLQLNKIKCFNIHKDLTDYLKRKIKQDYSIEESTLFPHLNDDAERIKENVLNSIAGS